MKRIMTLSAALVAGALVALPAVAAKSPYTAASRLADGEVNQVVSDVESALGEAGFEVVGSYHPMDMEGRAVVVATDDALLEAIEKRPTTTREGHTIPAAGLRIGVFQSEKGSVEISYVNPTYLYNAYFQDAYPEVKDEARDAEQRLQDALGGIGQEAGEAFGGEVEDLEHYHYMVFMPYFEDHIQLAEHDDFDAAVRTIRANLNQGVGETAPVYEVVMPERKMAVFGVAMNDEHNGVPSWYPKLIQRHVAALPYELYVVGGKAFMLHGRFRIALSWPELTMATFSNIMDAPGDTERTLREVASD
ncbi:hypothetical protein [Thiohalorhabdus denitrificans]|uniref:Uncharacterized protein n=1 Tax=Thiohalorhabdus denitrificans TaxID=381306 RepID=A0A1G5FCP6_9GAMM|nr:hypothetical protein [Thiohalorhabdus denitrificans]SCY37016.1 hypothetical protein SAMN05661077_1910 [Thiohalorhabdus denitrificans]